jgi:ATPase family AAA domain-containing protein 3A/B
MQEQNRRRDEESVAKQEQMRRQTMQYKHQLRREADQAQIFAKENAKKERMYATKDLRHEEIRIKEHERRLTKSELWTKNLEIVGSGVKNYVSDFGNLATLAGGLTLAFFGW